KTSIAVEQAEIAGDEISVRIEGGAVLVFVLVIADGQIAFDADLADLARRTRPSTLGIDDAHIDAGQRSPDAHRANLQRFRRVGDRAVAVGLGETIDVANLGRAELDHAPYLLGRAHRAARAQAADIARRPIRMLGERLRHVGRAVEQSAALAFDQAQRL